MATAIAAAHGSSDFLEEIHRSRSRVLLLDYDGTIAPFSIQRDRAVPYPEVADLLRLIIDSCNTRVAMISGRPARQLRELAGLDPQPEIWGSHGLERLLPNGTYKCADIDEHAAKILCEAIAWLDHEGLSALREVKHGAVAVHWRGLPEPRAQEARICAYRILSAFTGLAELSLCEFDCGLELRVRKSGKGDAVRIILSEVEDDVPIAYLGDDVTDEYAFRALLGRGLTVLVRPTYRFTAAQVWMRPPEDLTEFLADWVRACGGHV